MVITKEKELKKLSGWLVYTQWKQKSYLQLVQNPFKNYKPNTVEILNFFRQQFFTVYMKLVILRSYSNPTLFHQKPSKEGRRNLTCYISHQSSTNESFQIVRVKAITFFTLNPFYRLKTYWFQFSFFCFINLKFNFNGYVIWFN